MNDLIGEWKAAARRADMVRGRIAQLARKSVPVSRTLLLELAQRKQDVLAALQAVREARARPDLLP